MKRPRQYIATGGPVKVYFRFFGCSRNSLYAGASRNKSQTATHVATNKVRACKDQKRMDEFRSLLEPKASLVGCDVEGGLIDLLIKIEVR